MTMNPLPPQAYTKETLQKAYTWLLTQNASIKDMASSQDMLISLYLKAQRSGDASLETPSIQNFKQELKNLAGIMGDLQTPSQVKPQMAQIAAQPNAAPTNSEARTTRASMPQSFIQSYPTSTATSTPGSADPSTTLSQLDAQSLLAIQEVRATLNLSSDIEALRALIALGIKQFNKI